MLTRRSRVYQTSISMSTGDNGMPAALPTSPNNFGNFPKNQFNLASPSLIPQPVINPKARRRCDSEVYVKPATDNPTLFEGQDKVQPLRPRPTRNAFNAIRSSSNNNNNVNSNNSNRFDSSNKAAIRANFLFGKSDPSSTNRNSSETSNRPQYNNWAQRYRVSSTEEPGQGSILSRNGLSQTSSQRNHEVHRVDNSPVRSIFEESENNPSPIFRAPHAAPRMSQSVNGLGRRAHTQLEISTTATTRYRQQISENDSARVVCPEVPAAADPGLSSAFERHRWERNSMNSEATSLASYGTNGEDGIVFEPRATLLKGVMWLQREKVFSRWKERFFVLTKDYLQCFKKSTSLITEMGGFVFRVRLCEVDELELIVRRGYLTISLATPKIGKLLIRKPDGIRRWYQIIQDCVASCKERQESDREKNRFLMRKQLTDSSSMEAWIQSRKQRIDPNYANWTETGSCFSETETGTLLSNNNHGSRKSLETTDYGFIDGPVRRLLSYQRGTSARELKSIDERRPAAPPVTSSSTASTSTAFQSPPPSTLLARKSMSNKSEVASSICTTFSRDSGIDSMNAANSPGSILSNNSSHATNASNSVTPTSVTPTRALTESPSDIASTSFNYCDQFSRKITLV